MAFCFYMENNTIQINDLYDQNKLYKDFRAYFDINLSVMNFTNTLLDRADERRLKPETMSSFEVVCALFLLKSAKSFTSIQILCNKGHGEDGAILLRALLENFLHLKYICKDEDAHAKKFLAYEAISRKLILDRLQREKTYLRSVRDEILKLRDIISNDFERFKKDFTITKNGKEMIDKRYKRSWCGLQLSQVAEKVSLKDLYDLVYRYYSSFTHPDIRGVKEFFQSTVSGIIFKCHPTPNLLSGVLPTSTSYYSAILDKWRRTFHLGFDLEMENLHEKFIKSNIDIIRI